MKPGADVEVAQEFARPDASCQRADVIDILNNYTATTAAASCEASECGLHRHGATPVSSPCKTAN